MTIYAIKHIHRMPFYVLCRSRPGEGDFALLADENKSSLFAKKDVHIERICVICRPRRGESAF